MEGSEKTLESLLRNLQEGRETVLDVAEDGKSVAFGFRKLAPEIVAPERAESPPRAHLFHTPGSVCDYVNEYGSDKTVILLDGTALAGQIVLYEDADTGFEVLGFKPMLHPLFTEWQAVTGKRLDVMQFAEFVLNHRRQIIEPDGKTAAMIFSQIRADKTTTIHRGEGREAINGIVVSVKIGAQQRDVPVEIPDSLTIRVPLFVGMAPQDIVIDLLVTEIDDRVFVITAASGVQEAMHQAFEAMTQEIREGISHDKATVGLGEIGHGQWAYLKA